MCVFHLSVHPMQRSLSFFVGVGVGVGGGGLNFDARRRDIDDVFLTKLDHSQARCVFPLLVAVFVASNIETRQTIL